MLAPYFCIRSRNEKSWKVFWLQVDGSSIDSLRLDFEKLLFQDVIISHSELVGDFPGFMASSKRYIFSHIWITYPYFLPYA